MTATGFLDIATYISVALIALSLAIAFVRLVLGPTLADRVVALDMMTTLIIAFCGIVAVLTAVAAFLDVAIVMALVGFLATVALARYAERRDPENKAHADD
ncbi:MULTISPECIES: monovalent cation/H+ antiporter complex subunit F [unclassified Yoonia]|uniref:monovalent cation/H+ antiporter complex subunit F n=1 Tax=unclassified Yoonia TaxID=2629118 RepID=UPI002AFE5735|nr:MULTISPECIES: monovalent cation/H+ antiporter complex subunit F [unclassified Yoonia]